MKIKSKAGRGEFLSLLSVFVLFVGLLTMVFGFDANFRTDASAKEGLPDEWLVSFGLWGTPNADWATARAVLETLNRAGIKATEIERFRNSRWDAHWLVFPPTLNNFALESGVGYVVMIDPVSKMKNFDMNKLLESSYEKVSSVTWNVASGYNYLSFPLGVINRLKVTDTEKLCLSLKNKLGGAFSVDEINQMRPNPYPYDSGDSVWSAYICGSADGKFSIKAGEGYFIKLTRLDGGTGFVDVNWP
ncbi:hypothetical protein A2397_03490 [Candidatus Amesbacteria bacterium RIFOXYB1_FULL_44_23]|uniref:Uncharacterized protein n=1 Tax=Candidatus Amesbacteria bacterium RIFOXYB1_FULL_44_23 TaxID=1797263 RepID=A0A1F4ZRX0_9BACT|nr:MAG: hypothetical protein A2397_03490 [Candidatus Amesbacteria bacterium RIFOXYB1_FULL_44_23]